MQYHHRFIESLDTAAPFIMMPFFTLVGDCLCVCRHVQREGVWKVSTRCAFGLSTCIHTVILSLLCLFFAHTISIYLYIYIYVKTKTGASINLPVFFRSLPFAFVMFIARAVCIIIGSAVPGYFLKQSKVINLTIWMTLLPQGVPIFHCFPVEWFPISWKLWGPQTRTNWAGLDIQAARKVCKKLGKFRIQSCHLHIFLY